MKVRRSIARIAVATMIAATVAVPTASAMSPEGVIYGSAEYAAEQQDMHASTVHEPKSSAGDRRGEGSIVGSRVLSQADHGTEAAKGPSMSTPPAGMPTPPITLLFAGAVALSALGLMVRQTRRTQARPVR